MAVDVDDRIRRQVARVQEAFRPAVAGAKWVNPTLCHITLKFLGYVPANQLPAIIEAGRQAANGAQPFELTFRGVGAFPRWRGARVLWIGVDGGAALRSLQARVETELAPLGYEPEGRPFSPHLTLARLKQPPGRGIEELAQHWEHQRFGSIRIEELRLMRSDLRPSGPVYTTIEAVPLAAA